MNYNARQNWEIIKQLTITDFKLRYSGSYLGYLWSILKPLAIFAVLYIVFAKMLRFGADIANYPTYLLIGILLWSFFAEVTINGLQSIVSRSHLVKKIYFPRIIIVLVSSFSALINLFFNFLTLAAFMIYFRVDVLHWQTLLVPVYILELWLFGFGLSLILSTLYVRFRDCSYIWEIGLQIWFYLTPIIYPISMVAVNYQEYILLNPLAQIISDFRHIFISFATPNNFFYPYPQIVMVMVIFLIGLFIFQNSEKSFAEKI